MSVVGKGSIVATVLTLLFIPVVKHGHVLGHKIRKGATYAVKCTPGQPVPATKRNLELGVAGALCKRTITRFVTLNSKGETVRVEVKTRSGR